MVFLVSFNLIVVEVAYTLCGRLMFSCTHIKILSDLTLVRIASQMMMTSIAQHIKKNKQSRKIYCIFKTFTEKEKEWLFVNTLNLLIHSLQRRLMSRMSRNS